MFDIGSSELLLIIIVAVVVIGPKDLPRVLYKLGQIIGKGRAMTRHFRSGIDEMIRQAELEEMEKKWAADNARIMAQTPAPASDSVLDHAASPALSVPPVLSAPEAPPTPHAGPGFGPAETDVGSYAVGPDSDSARPKDEGYKPFVAGSAPHSDPHSKNGPAV
ncbi:MAG TPA: Sec-independent protein translocase protein TatB [Sphingobium sp.]